MKHNLQITIILLTMFFVTQLIGLAVIHAYTPRMQSVIINGTEQNVSVSPLLPYNLEPPEGITPEVSFVSIIISFIIAVLIILLLTRIKAKWFLRIWFFVVVIIALGVTLNSLLFYLKVPHSALIAALIALPLAFFKIFRRNLTIHNFTELMIYPGLAAVFVAILYSAEHVSRSILAISLLLIFISAYDIYAVWHAGFMQKMAKFQINHLKVFAGFFVPYAGKEQREKIKLLKQKYQNKKIPDKVIKSKKIKVSLAILGGGDVVFPLIAAGIFLRAFGLFSALSVSVFSVLALAVLFLAAKKGKFYPAMPFLTAGIFLGMLVGWLVF